MEWSLLIKGILVCYILYYSGMFLFDFIKSKQPQAATNSNVSYDIKDLLENEDRAIPVVAKDFILSNGSNASSKQPPSANSTIDNGATAIEFLGPVIGQSLPIQDFVKIIKKAKSAVRY